MMGLAEQLGMYLGKMGLHPTSLCPHVEVHVEPWKLYSNSLLDAEGLGFFFGSHLLQPLPLTWRGEFISCLWAHALDSFIESEPQVTNSLLPSPVQSMVPRRIRRTLLPPRKGLPVRIGLGGAVCVSFGKTKCCRGRLLAECHDPWGMGKAVGVSETL